jgi:6-phosphogluconolactonase (cycloisomerase 2 family)
VNKYFYGVALLALAGLCASCGGSGTHVLYVLSPGASEVTGYTISGASLSEVATPVTTGLDPVSLAVHPSGNFLYAADSAANEISVLSIGGSGEYSLVSTNASNLSEPIAVAADPSGAYLYAANGGGNTLAAFSVDTSSGSLAPITGSPFSTPFRPKCMIESPVLTVLYAGSQGFVWEIPMAPTGPEEYLSFSGAGNPSALAIDPANRFLYVADSSANVVYAYTIASDGSVALVSGAPFAAGGSTPVAMAIDPSGSFLYVVDKGSNWVSGFAIDQTTGALTAVSGSPFSVGTAPVSAAFDGNTGNLYISNQGSNNVSSFSMSSTSGVLSSLGAAAAVSSGPAAIVIVDK